MRPLFIAHFYFYFCNKQRCKTPFLVPISCFSENINVSQKRRQHLWARSNTVIRFAGVQFSSNTASV